MCVANGWAQTWCKPKLLPSPSVFQLCTPKQACLISHYCNISGNYEAGLLSFPFRPRACVFKAERLLFTLLSPDSTRGEAVARLATVITPVLGNCYIREPTGDSMWRRNGRCKPCRTEGGGGARAVAEWWIVCGYSWDYWVTKKQKCASF